jgi:transposase
MSRLDHALEPKGASVHRVEVITGGGERRRRWSDDEKAAAIEESLRPGVVVSEVARRRGLTPQQLFSWRRAARRKVLAEVAFTPVVVEPAIAAACSPGHNADRSHVIEVHIHGANVWVWREAPANMVTAIITALKAGS